MKNESTDTEKIDGSWFERHTEVEPWLLSTSEPSSKHHIDAFLGNGYIGQRISAVGVGPGNPRKSEHRTASGCVIQGFWGDSELLDVPVWSNLDCLIDGLSIQDLQSGWRDYSQTLDQRRGILRTNYKVVTPGKSLDICFEVYLCRSRKNIGVIECTIIPQFNGSVDLIDSLDGSHLHEAIDWCRRSSDSLKDPISLEVSMGSRRITVISKNTIGSVKILDVKPIELPFCSSRKVQLECKIGTPIEFTKVVAILTNSETLVPSLNNLDLLEAAASDIDLLRKEHVDAWSDIWKGHIEVSHPGLQKIVNSSFYQLYSSIEENGTDSLGPMGLSSRKWGGRVFWDADLWMFPVIGLLNPKLGKSFVEYRWKTLPGAQRNAGAESKQGAMYAWESAEYGDEIIPHMPFHHQHHVNSDIALSQWWYYLISGDEDFFFHKGSEIILESARFWESWIEYNERYDRYEIRKVCCADEWAKIKDNNSFTSYSAIKNFELAEKVLNFRGTTPPKKWKDYKDKIWIPFDSENQRILEYEGYAGQTIKQADTALLFYPYEMEMDENIKSNTLNYYQSKYPAGNIMMSSSFDGIIHCELKRPQDAWECLHKLLPHFREPFLLASESPLNERIAFHTGVGGLLQLMVMGFGGIRIHDDGLQIEPCLPDEIDYLHIKNVHFKGKPFSIEITHNSVEVNGLDEDLDFKLYTKENSSTVLRVN